MSIIFIIFICVKSHFFKSDLMKRSFNNDKRKQSHKYNDTQYKRPQTTEKDVCYGQ